MSTRRSSSELKRSDWIFLAAGAATLTVVVLVTRSEAVNWSRVYLPIVLWALIIAFAGAFGLEVSSGYIGLDNMLVISGYLALDLGPALWAALLGTFLSHIILIIWADPFGAPRRSALRSVAHSASNMTFQVMSLLPGAFAYRFAGGRLPFPGPLGSAGAILLPLAALVVAYAATNNLIFAIFLQITGESVRDYFRRSGRAIALFELAPLPLAGLMAAFYNELGTLMFAGLYVCLAAVIFIIYGLGRARAEAEQRMRHLTTLNAIGEAMGNSPDVPELLEAIHQHIGQLLDASNLCVVFYDADTDQVSFPLCYENGERCYPKPRRANNSLLRYVIRTRQPLLLRENVSASIARLGVSPLDQPAESWLGVPILTDGRVPGVIVAQSQTRRAYNRGHLELLTTVAAQVSIAIRNAQLYSAMRQRATELAILNSVSAAIGATLDLERVLQIITTSVGPISGCQKSAVFLLNEAGDELYLAQSYGLSRTYVERSRRLKVGPGERGRVVVQRHPLVVTDVITAPGLEELVPLAQAEGFHGMVEAPLTAQNVVVGMLALYFAEAHSLAQAEMDLLETFANQAAVAVSNARLYARTDQALARRVEELSALEVIGRELAGTLDVARISDRIVERTLQVTNAHMGGVVLIDETGAGGKFVAQRGYPLETIRFYLRQPWPLTQGILGRALQTGLVVNVPDVRLDTDYVLADPEVRSQLSVPIVRKGRVLGVITLESYQMAAFDRATTALVQQLANQAAVAIENAQLFQAVAEGRDKLRAILNSSREGVLMFDLTGRVVMANPRLEELLGIPRARIEGRRLTDGPDESGLDITAQLGYSPAEFETVLAQLQQGQGPAERQSVYQVTRPAKRFIERLVIPVLDGSGQRVGWMITLRDTTEERELQQMRESLTSMIVHDLRGPLAAILSGLQLLSEMLPESGYSGPMLDAVSVSERSCFKLLALVNSLLDISKIKAGRMEISPQPTDLAKVVAITVDWFSPLAQELEVALTSHVEGNWRVFADDEKIGRVLNNLVDNALKFTPTGGQVMVLAEPAPGEKGFVRCAVRDTGQGIPPEYHERIFDYFTQVPDTRGKRRGSGVGLTFCKLAVEAHGGRIWVESQEGQGSTFYFTLPVSDQ